MAQERLQKYLSSAGVSSRRNSEDIIRQGRVEVNGKVVRELPVFVDPAKDKVKVDGCYVREDKKVYFLLNKPKKVLCTSKDPQGRTKAIDLVPCKQRIHCVGRLDTETFGLILLTNDNALTNQLTHPRYGVPKTYIARVDGKITPQAVGKLKKGVWLSEGKTGKAAVKVVKKGRDGGMLEITISQGLNRQVRRSLAKVGLKVRSLKRTRIGNISDRGLGVGKYRPLTNEELKHLRKISRR